MQEIRLALTTSAAGRYNIPIGKAPPKVGGFQGKEPTGWFCRFCRRFGLGRCGSTPCVSEFRSFGVCAAGCFLFVLNKFPPVFLLCLLVGYFCRLFRLMWFDHFPGSSCWAEKRLLGPKCSLFKINILDVMVDGIFLLGIAGSYTKAANGNRMEANCAFFPFKQPQKNGRNYQTRLCHCL